MGADLGLEIALYNSGMSMKLKNFLPIIGLLSFLAAGFAGCGVFGIGSWPQPEGRSESDPTSQSPDTRPVAGEACDGVDNDADGVIDEGCDCSGDESRECASLEFGICATGIQHCTGGIWRDCEELVDAGDAQLGQLSFDSVTPELWGPQSEENLVLVTQLVTPCDGLIPPEVVVELWVDSPVMRVLYRLKDGGANGDVTAGDGLYSLEIENPFGPGVESQPVYLVASTRIDGQAYSATYTLNPEAGE